LFFLSIFSETKFHDFLKIKFTSYLLIFILLIVYISCCDDPQNIRLSDSENQFIPYVINDTLRYKNLVSEDITEFVVTDIESEFFDNNSPGAMVVGPCDSDFYETKTLKLESESCLMEYSVSVLGEPASFRFSIYNCDLFISAGINNNSQRSLYQDGTYTVEGITYQPVYVLSNANSRVLVTPGVGILSFTDEATGEEYVFFE
jgi:hypothetical protein